MLPKPYGMMLGVAAVTGAAVWWMTRPKPAPGSSAEAIERSNPSWLSSIGATGEITSMGIPRPVLKGRY